MTISHSERFLRQVSEIAESVDHEAIERIALGLADLRGRGGRLFVIGVGGSASNSSHAVSDFRKLARIEAYAPTDNVSELTARTNDEGWDTVFTGWLDISQANGKDAVFILSVGGGDMDRNVSPNIVRAVDEAKKRGMQVYGIVGRDGGYTKRRGDEVVVIPTVDSNHITPLSESFQAIVWHCLVFHPNLILLESKWESLGKDTAS
jgi:D-sedoheptulose 7-phosphate isomerase